MKNIVKILSLSTIIFISFSAKSYAYDEQVDENIINSNVESKINVEKNDTDLENDGETESESNNRNFDSEINSDSDNKDSNNKEYDSRENNSSNENDYSIKNKRTLYKFNNLSNKIDNYESNFKFYKKDNNIYCVNANDNKPVDKGWIEHKGKKYFCKKDGQLYVNQIISFGPKVAYYMGSDGSVVKSVFRDKEVLRHADYNTGILSHIGWIEENGKRYYSKNNLGELYTNQIISFGPKVAYYMGSDGSIVKSVFKDKEVLRHADKYTGILSHSGWIEENGKRYYSKNNLGELYTNQIISFGPKVAYYMGSDGTTSKSFFVDKGILRHADKYTGILSHIGWIEENGKRYYSKNNLGELYTNQIISFGPKVAYYMGNDGATSKSFFWDRGILRHADKYTGILSHIGWIEENGKKYYSKNNFGELYRNQIISFGPKVKYYMGSDGSVGGLISGWFIKDGKTSYVFTNGKLAKGHVDIDGLKYYFDNKGYLRSKVGIDISIWNKIINWNDIKKAGIEFVIIRSSGSYAANGKLYKDDNFISNIRGAISAGLKVGVYHYSQAITKQEAINEARFVDSIIRPYKSKITLPVTFDREIYSAGNGHLGRTHNIGKDRDTEVSLAFLDEITRLGYKASFYSYTNYLNNRINMDKISKKYPVWVAQYHYKCDYKGSYYMWQYTSKGKIKGIRGNIDLNIMYV